MNFKINGKTESISRIIHYAIREMQVKAHMLIPAIFPIAAPKLIGLALTSQCNYRCSFCEINGVVNKLSQTNNDYQKNQMSMEFVKSLSPLLKKALTIDLGGITAIGEPLMAPDFQDICTYLRSINRSLRFHITTNGSLMKTAVTDTLLELVPLTVTFSLHAISENIYKQIMSNSFEKTIENIRYFCKKSQNNTLVEKHINFGVGTHNCDDGFKIIDFAKDNNIDFIHIYFYYQSPNDLSEKYSFYSDPEKGNEIIAAIYKHAEKSGIKMIPPEPPVLKPSCSPTIQNPTRCEISNRCQAPFDNLILKSNPFTKGKCGLCVCNRIIPFDIPINSPLKKEDIKWIWDHPLLQMLRYNPSKSPICTFCRSKETPFLRSTDYSTYSLRRDNAIKETLSQFQDYRVSPSGEVTLYSEHVYSI
jgi:wyosine [tRNA(Phe)-imidazoG37] synthetase (radical SAM superfamily)